VENGDPSSNKKTDLNTFFNSPESIKLREDLKKAHNESIQKSVGWYKMLSSEDKYKAVEALCYIITKAEREGTSHRGLMSKLDVYPEGFWIDGLMDIHNSLWSEYNKQKYDSELDKEIEMLQNFTENERDH
jgi:hypothetical protein